MPSVEICVCCWQGCSFLHEAGPPPLGNVCADGSRCVAGLPVPARGGQLCSRNHVAVLDAKLIDPTERFIASCRGGKGWPGASVSSLAGSCLGHWVRQLSRLTLLSPEGHRETLALMVASTYLVQRAGLMYDWADVPALPASDAMAGPGEQSLSDHSQDFCLRGAQTHHSCLRERRKPFTWVCSKIQEKNK